MIVGAVIYEVRFFITERCSGQAFESPYPDIYKYGVCGVNGQHFCLWHRRFGFESRQTPIRYERSLMVKIGGSNPSDGGSIPSARAIIGCVKLVSLMMFVLNHDIADE